MVAEKYIVATLENSFHIAVRNILNPSGYMFIANSNDPLSLMRLIRNYSPDFVVIDLEMHWRELRHTIENIDEELLCACILVGYSKDIEVTNVLDNSSVVSYCSKPINIDMLLNVVEMSNMNFKRISQLNEKLTKVKDSFESRKLVERAKCILMELNGISENEAYIRMRKKSMDSRLSMKEIAEAIILARQLGGKK